MPKREENIETRFARKVQRSAPDACWEWQGGIANTGYGQMSVRRPDGRWTMENTHRIAWKLVQGAIPAGQCVLHRCDNRKCVNPAHLFLGTKADNIADMVSKGRQARGEKKPLTTPLSAQCVAAIKAALAPFTGNRVRRGVVRDLAEKFGVCRASVTNIGKGKTWRHAS